MGEAFGRRDLELKTLGSAATHVDAMGGLGEEGGDAATQRG